MSSILFEIVLSICRAALMAVLELPKDSPHRRAVLDHIKRLRAEFQPSSTPSAIDRTEKLGYLVDWFEAGAKVEDLMISMSKVGDATSWDLPKDVGSFDTRLLNPVADPPRTRDARLHPKPGDRINLDDGTALRVETIAETFGRETIHGSRILKDGLELPFTVSLNGFRKMARRTV